ncbi:hypothetical protein XNA1_3260010 [Xenorhabdus nematophila str. Anatoliense]|nr:hypothetical protein XNA1_3260010 [Xenorhabdus nematophila str. Anatoliense]
MSNSRLAFFRLFYRQRIIIDLTFRYKSKKGGGLHAKKHKNKIPRRTLGSKSSIWL